MIAMALLREFEILIADEPFSGLDPKQIATLKPCCWSKKARANSSFYPVICWTWRRMCVTSTSL